MIFIITIGGSVYETFDNETEATDTYDALRRSYPKFEIEIKAQDMTEAKPGRLFGVHLDGATK